MPEQTDLAKRVLALKADADRAIQLRARADAQLAQARKNLADVNEQLKALGVEPDQAEQQLALMEAALDKKVGEFQTSVTAEITTYQQILEAGR